MSICDLIHWINIERNSMTDKAAEFISDSLRKLPNLSSLRLNICG